jgi:hypothetical protein
MLAEFHLYNGNKLKISSNGEIFLIEKHKGKETKRQVQCDILDFFPYVQKVQIKNILKNVDSELFNLIREKFSEYEEIHNCPFGSLENKPIDLKNGNIFLGEVASEQIFGTGKNILNYFNPPGADQNVNTNYLKFKSINGAILFIAKTPIKHSISWDSINGGSSNQDSDNINSGVYGAMKKTINEEIYRIRLLKGENEFLPSGVKAANQFSSEWDDLMTALVSSNAGYDNERLIRDSSQGYGARSWVQEAGYIYSSFRVCRGGLDISSINDCDSDAEDSRCGWRPVLELEN